jgi:Spy/CpxP family protein refolding chaperone
MNKSSKNIFILLAAIFFLSSGTLAFAQMGKGYNYPARMHYGQWRHLRGYGGAGYGMFGDLSEDQIRNLDEERTAFWEATKDLRQQIYQKQLELASELAKQKPDAAAASAVQQQISDLMAQLAQKRLEHFLRVQKINPDAGRGGPMGFGMMGYGMMHHDMMGSGGYGGWDRPDCPLSGPGGGYGMGPGMMYPNMMGPGGYGGWNRSSGGYGMGPGMMYPNMMGPGGYGGWNRSWGGYSMEPGMTGPGGGRSSGPGMMNRNDYQQYHDTRIAPPEKNPAVNKEN